MPTTRQPPAPVWYGIEVVTSLYGAMVFTFTAVYLVREVGASPLQLVLVGTVMEVAYFLFEVPIGVVADTYSRRLSVIVGIALEGVASALVGALVWYPSVLLAYALWGVGAAFLSGALEAWIADEAGRERLPGLLLRAARWGWAAGIAGVGIGAALATVDLQLPIVLGGVTMVALAVALAVVMPERGFSAAPRGERTSWQAMTRTARAGARLVRRTPLLLLLLGIAAFWGASSESFDRLWEAHFLVDVGLPRVGERDPVVWFGVIGAASLLVSLLVSSVLIRRLERLDDVGMARTLLAFNVGLVAALVVFALALGFWVAVVAYLVARFVRSLVVPVWMAWLNRQIDDSSVRATVISIMGQADAVGQFTGGPAIGAAGNVFGIRAALVAGAALLAPAVGLYTRALAHGGKEPELADAAQVAEV